jgi:hypothetical protein
MTAKVEKHSLAPNAEFPSKPIEDESFDNKMNSRSFRQKPPILQIRKLSHGPTHLASLSLLHVLDKS